MRRRARWVLAMVTVLAGGCASLPSAEESPAQRAAKRLPLAPCKVEGVEEELLCGTLAVWENRDTRAGRKIDLHLVVVPALAEPVAPDPVFALSGGPGEGATDQAPGWAEEGGEIRRHRDIVLVDQRGTGRSNRLDCRLPEDPKDTQAYFEPVLPADAVAKCRAELEKIADLELYTTSIAADDLDEARAFLGYQRINLEGGSYGTRMAQVYLRRHESRVRSVLLTGVAGMNQHLPLWHARDGQRALDLLFDRCEAEPACAAAFPSVRAELPAVLSRLSRERGRTTVKSPESGQPVEVTIPRDIFAEQLRFLLYAPRTAAALPYVVHRAALGDFAPFGRVAILWEPALRGALAMGMHLSVTCAEDLPFIDPAQVDAAVAGTSLGAYRVRQQQAACAEWPRGQAPPGFHELIRSEVPVLMVSGGLDPVTPPRWAEAALPHLSRGSHLLIPEGHHGFGGLENRDCFQRLTDQFVLEGSAESLDFSCAATMSRPPFITDAAGFEALMAELED